MIKKVQITLIKYYYLVNSNPLTNIIMKKIGGYVALFGVLAIVLPFFNLQLRLLGWIDTWGETVSWGIKIGLIVVGAALFFMGGSSESSEAEEATDTE